MPLRAANMPLPVAFVILLLSSPFVAQGNAEEGDPLAIIRTKTGSLRIEAMSGFSVEITKPANDSNADLTLIAVDGLRIAHVTHTKLGVEDVQAIRSCDVLVADVPADELESAISLAKTSNAKRLIVNANTAVDGAKKHVGNTLAISASGNDDALQIIQLGNVPIELPDELAQLLDAKEVACRASQAVFAPLSIEQMNFRPENGSHTPRWNAEHMMGRELVFFSQIFHAIEPAIPVMDLNPKQMPPDYQAKHPDWTGAEEAWQMQRVNALTRRFAHLLVDLPLDEKPAGSRWTPRGLLKQMERHYGEHTANVQLKFKLPGWPEK